MHDFIEAQGLPACVSVVPEMWHTGAVLVSATPGTESAPLPGSSWTFKKAEG